MHISVPRGAGIHLTRTIVPVNPHIHYIFALFLLAFFFLRVKYILGCCSPTIVVVLAVKNVDARLQ